jgi:tetratricopeptide (TPR) repeat protein
VEEVILFRPWQASLFLAVAIFVIILSIPSRKDLGMYYFNSFEYDKAVDYLVEEGRVNSDDVFVLKKLKEYALIQGEVGKAYETQMQMLRVKPKNLEYMIEAEKLADWTERPEKKLEIKERRASLFRESNPILYRQLMSEVANGHRYLKNFESADRTYGIVGKFPESFYKEAAIKYFLARKKADQAEALLAFYSKDHPNNKEFNTFYYQTLMYQGNHEEAFSLVAKSLFPSGLFNINDLSLLRKKLKNLSLKEFKKSKDKIENLITIAFVLFVKEKRSGDFLGLVNAMGSHLPKLAPLLMDLGLKAYGLNEIKVSKQLRELAHKNPGKDFRELYLEGAEFFLANNLGQEALFYLKALTRHYPLNRRYWELLAETYELLGDKQKAIDALMKLYKLQKRKVDQVYLRSLDKSYLLALVGDQSSWQNFIVPKRKVLTPAEEKLLSLEERLVNSIYSLEDPKAKLKSFQDFLEENPESLSAKKGLAYTYYELGEGEKARDVFREIYTISPNDLEANQSLVSTWVEEKDWNKVKRAMKILPNNGPEYDEIFQEYYFSKDEKRYKEFCSKTKNINSIIDCTYRSGDLERALFLTREHSKEGKSNCVIYLKRLYLEAEVGDPEWVDRELEQGSSCLNQINRPALLKFVEGQNMIRGRREFWRFEQTLGLLETDQFQLGDTDIRLMKKFKKYALTAEVEYDKVLWRGDAAFSYTLLGASLYFDDGSAITFGPTFMNGDKESRPGFFSQYFRNMTNAFFSAELRVNRPLSFTRDLAIERTAYSSGVEFYGNYRTPNRNWTLIGYANIQKINYRDDSSTFSQVTVEGLKSLYTNEGNKPWEILTGLQLNNSNLASARPVIRDNFLNKSLAYHAVVRADYNYPDNFIPQKWSGLVRFGIGGDLQRDIAPGKSIQAMGQINHSLTKRSKITLGAEYYSEFLGVNRGDTRLYRLGFLQDF